MKSLSTFLLLMVTAFCFAKNNSVCNSTNVVGLPVVTLKPVSYIPGNYTDIISGGTIVSNGGAAIFANGLVWSTQRHPNINTNEGITTDGVVGVGSSFVSTMTGLIPGQYYFVKAYASNSVGTAYSKEIVVFAQTNIYDGLYNLNFTNYHPTFNPNYIGFNNVKVELRTTSANAVKLYWISDYSNSDMPGGFVEGYKCPSSINGVLNALGNQEPEYTIDPVTNEVSVANTSATATITYVLSPYTSPPVQSTYDPITKKISAQWGYVTSAPREWTQEFNYISPRSSTIPYVLYSMTPTTGTSGTIITVKGINFSGYDARAFYGSKIGSNINYKLIDSLSIVSDSVMKVWVGSSPISANDTLFIGDDFLPGFNYYAPPAITNSGWQYFGAPGSTQTAPKIAFDNNNVPYQVYLDSAIRKLVVKKYINGSWVAVGNPISDGFGSKYNIIIDNNNVPVVAFVDSMNGNRITIRGYYGNAWLTVGNPGLCGPSNYQSGYAGILYDDYLKIDGNNSLYLLGNNLVTKTITSQNLNLSIPDLNADGISNSIFMSSIPPGAKVQNVSVTVNVPHTNCGELVMNLMAPNGKTIALDKFIEGQIYGQQGFYPTQGFIGTTFSSSGGSLLYSSTNSTFTSTNPTYTNVIATYAADANDYDSYLDPAIYPFTFTYPNGFFPDANSFGELFSNPNGAWTLAIADGFSTELNGVVDTGKLVSWSLSISYYINPNDTLDVVNVYKNSGNGWIELGETGISDVVGFAIDKVNNQPYLSYPSYDATSFLNVTSVKKFDGNNWNNLPDIPAAPVGAFYSSCTTDNLGNPIVAFQDDNSFERMSVYAFNNNSWTPLGPLQFSKSRVYYFKIVADRKGNPNVIFRDEAINDQISAMTYNKATNSWSYLGARAGISGIFSYNSIPGLVFDTANVPYISMADLKYGNRGSILRLGSLLQGNFTTPSGDSIPYVKVKVNGNILIDTLSKLNGSYSAIVSNGNTYTITPSKNNDIVKSNGVSTLDIIKIQSHILRVDTLNSPYKIIAADVNSSGDVSSLDLLYIRKLILGTDTTFPGNKLWSFIDANQTFSNAYNPFPYSNTKTYNSNSSTGNTNFKGVKLGDVTYDWNKNILRPYNLDPIELSADTIWMSGSNDIHVNFRVKNFNKITGMQFTMGWNPQYFSFVNMGSNPLNIQYGTAHQNEGLITFLWNEATNKGITLNNGDFLFELILRKNADFNIEQLNLNSSVTNIESYDENLDFHNIILKGGILSKEKESTPANSEGDRIAIYPNPSNGIMNLHLPAKYGTSFQLRLFNSAGQLVGVKNINRTESQINLRINSKEFGGVKKGIYELRLINDQLDQSFKLYLLD